MMKRIASLLAASAAFASPALAADVIYSEPAPAPVVVVEAPVGFNGLYIGGQLGGAFNPEDPDLLDLSTNGFDLDDIVPGLTSPAGAGGFPANTLGAAFGDSFSSEFDSSFVGGVHIGYDMQFDGFVVGLVADISAIDVSITQSAFSNTPAFYTAERSLDYLGTGRVRAGALVTDRMLAYATGGFAYGEIDYSFSTDSPVVTGNDRSNAAARDADINEDDDEFGYTIGGGIEVLVTDNISFGAEYLYTNLGDSSSSTRLDGGPFDGDASNGAATSGNSTDFESNDDFDFHTIAAKLSYRFN